MNEIWKDVPGYEGCYKASNTGLIKSVDRKYIGNRNALTIMKGKIVGRIGEDGYAHANLSVNGKRKMSLAHRLVALAFIPNPENKPFVNHINGIKHDNRVENLEWCTPKENDIHASINGLKAFGERNSASKLTAELVKEIRSKYVRRKYTNKMLAKEYNMSYHEIQLINQGKRWPIKS